MNEIKGTKLMIGANEVTPTVCVMTKAQWATTKEGKED